MVVVVVFEVAVAGAKGKGAIPGASDSLMRGSRRLDMGRRHAPSVTLRDCGPRFRVNVGPQLTIRVYLQCSPRQLSSLYPA